MKSEKQAEHLRKLAENKCGKKLSQETKDKISLGNKGKLAGDKNHKWNGGVVIVGGYKYVMNKTHPYSTKLGYVLEHRMIMENNIGRYLKKTEAIHHIDGNILNNNINNLELCESNGKHFIEHHLISRDNLGRFQCA